MKMYTDVLIALLIMIAVPDIYCKTDLYHFTFNSRPVFHNFVSLYEIRAGNLTKL